MQWNIENIFIKIIYQQIEFWHEITHKELICH